jgi:branched-subunit amino acid aminotransferase/4-amino-4-deoxychorismate lyase
MPMPEPLAYLNGQFVPQGQAHLPLHDASFVFGATVTDLCRTFRHQLYRWPDHLARFRRSCRSTYIKLSENDGELTRLAEQLVANNTALLEPGQELALVVFATPGPVGYYAGQEGGVGDTAPTLGMHTFLLPFARYRRLFREGAHLIIPRTRHVPAACVDPRIKQRSRLHWWLAAREAAEVEAGAIALLVDLEGHVTETAGANFLVVRDGTVLSPPASAVLGGTSLQVVRELCRDLDISFAEVPLTPAECQQADEAFLTSTPYCMAGISRINGSPLPWPGLVFQRLLELWNSRVGLNIAAQITGVSPA